jgi:hypothetical protein
MSAWLLLSRSMHLPIKSDHLKKIHMPKQVDDEELDHFIKEVRPLPTYIANAFQSECGPSQPLSIRSRIQGFLFMATTIRCKLRLIALAACW